MQDAPIQVFHVAWYLKSVDRTVITLVNVYVDLVVFTRIAGSS